MTHVYLMYNILLLCFTDKLLFFFSSDESSYSAVHYSLVLVAYLGFMFFDLLYIAVIINYCSQCQLLTYYIENTQDKVRNKKYGNLNLASKVNCMLDISHSSIVRKKIICILTLQVE